MTSPLELHAAGLLRPRLEVANAFPIDGGTNRQRDRVGNEHPFAQYEYPR
ncbi:MAG: hypothetical protein QOJ42_2687, partial [Acidobacteriaceae bacterium]|nr:hypothetical protein [Acidobacteriaceae bacterium]